MGGGASPGETLWTWQSSDIVLGICAVGATLMYLDFMLIPLTMAYFTTFMMLPVLEAMERRPYTCAGGKMLCEETAPWTRLMPVVDEEATAANGEGGEVVYKMDEERNIVLEKRSSPGSDDFFKMAEDESGNPITGPDGQPVREKDSKGNDVKLDNAWVKELLMLQKVPHGIACLLTLFISFGTLGVLMSVVASNFSAFAANEEAKANEGQPTINEDLCRVGNDFINDLERDGVNIIRTRTCTRRTINTTKVYSDIQDTRTVDSDLFEGTDDSGLWSKDQTDRCKPFTVAGRELNVMRYQPRTFKCEQDWEKVVTLATPWCGMDMLSIASTDTGRGLRDAMDAADLRQFEECVDKMIGMNTARNTEGCDDNAESDGENCWMVNLAGAYAAVPERADPSGLTGDVAPNGNSTMTLAEQIDAVRPQFKRMLAGLTEAKRLMPEDPTPDAATDDPNDFVDLQIGCGNFNDDRDFLGVCDAIEAMGDGAKTEACGLSMADHTDVLTAECEASSTLTCDDKEYCYWTAGDDSVKEGCYLNQGIAENDWRVTDAIALNVDNLCPTACGLGQNPPQCMPQQMWARNYYLGELEKMRMVKPPVAYTLGVKIDNFAAHMSEVTENCSKIDLFCSPVLEDEYGQLMEGTPWEDLMATVGAVGALLSDVVLVLLLAVYILMERPQEEPEHRVVLEIEAMIKNYINLKIMLSAATGFLVAVFLGACNVQLAAVFGLLAFLLNFIPCVGSAIATVLPLPLIFLDDGIPPSMKLIAFLGPTTVQLYVGNALEPSLFGKSLNLTEISVLNALVLAQLCWGLPGAVLSVPMLGILKIVCHHTDHPIAKYTLALVRADAAYP